MGHRRFRRLLPSANCDRRMAIVARRSVFVVCNLAILNCRSTDGGRLTADSDRRSSHRRAHMWSGVHKCACTSVVKVSIKCRTSVVQVSIKCRPSVVHGSLKCRPTVVQVLPKWQLNVAQTSTKCPSSVVQVSFKCRSSVVQVSTKYWPRVGQASCKCGTSVTQASSKCRASVSQPDLVCVFST